MQSTTEQAIKVKEYFLEMERLVIVYHDDIHEKMMKELNLIKQNQKPKNNIQGGIIYIIEAKNTDLTLFKIGKTTNLKKRMDTYNTQNANDIEPLFIMKVNNITEVEKCIKNYAIKFQYRKYKEIYELDLYMLKNIIVLCTDFSKEMLYLFKNYEKETTKKLKRIRRSKSLYLYLYKNDSI
jgi:hypothetical protein